MKRNRKILVVDDQQDLREQLAKLLRKAGQKDETHSLVEQMRARLLGNKDAEKEVEAENPDDDLAPYIVETAAQGEDAWKMIKEANESDDPYAVMFLDMRMPPGWDGLETATKVREADKNIEIVIMTAYADHDQAQIAEQVGMPEKLLYIKKPFQAEEIYQLALSLTSKYTLERIDKERKQWLESLLRGMSKLKSSNVADASIYKTVLQAMLNFTKGESGSIAEFKEDASEKWVNITTIDTNEEAAKEYLKENIATLKESRTTQNINGKYILPLRKEDFFAVAVIDNVTTSTDPEWYKLLSLLVMTCSEILKNSFGVRSQGDTSAVNENSATSIKEALNTIKKEAESLTEDKADVKDISKNILSAVEKAVNKL